MHLFSRDTKVTAEQSFNTKQNFILVADLALKLQKRMAVHESVSTWKTWPKKTAYWSLRNLIILTFLVKTLMGLVMQNIYISIVDKTKQLRKKESSMVGIRGPFYYNEWGVKCSCLSSSNARYYVYYFSCTLSQNNAPPGVLFCLIFI